MKKILIFTILLSFLWVGSASALILFDDEIYNGSYYFNNAIREMTIFFNTTYEPWDTEASPGDPNPGGFGTTINWELTLDFSSWTNPPGGELPGRWEEWWGATSGRAGDFEYFEWNSNSDGTGDFYGVITEVYPGEMPLGPPGPWFIIGQFERERYTGSGPEYESWGSITGRVTNVPEPATMILLGTSLLGLTVLRRRFNK